MMIPRTVSEPERTMIDLPPTAIRGPSLEASRLPEARGYYGKIDVARRCRDPFRDYRTDEPIVITAE